MAILQTTGSTQGSGFHSTSGQNSGSFGAALRGALRELGRGSWVKIYSLNGPVRCFLFKSTVPVMCFLFIAIVPLNNLFLIVKHIILSYMHPKFSIVGRGGWLAT